MCTCVRGVLVRVRGVMCVRMCVRVYGGHGSDTKDAVKRQKFSPMQRYKPAILLEILAQKEKETTL